MDSMVFEIPFFELFDLVYRSCTKIFEDRYVDSDVVFFCHDDFPFVSPFFVLLLF